MGSSGSSSFSDYSRRKPNKDGNNGGSSGIDECGKAISTLLEEVSRCFYYMNYGKLPPTGTDLILTFNGLRLAVETNIGEEVGYLPTKYNYLAVCLDNGFKYTVIVKSSVLTPTPAMFVDIVPL